MLDGVEDWSLVLGVCDVKLGTQLDQQLHSLDVTFTCRIVDWSLPVLVLTVHRVSTLLTEEEDDILIALTRGVKERSLL